MEVILLQRLAKVGQMGDVVRVRDGYARNYLLPSGKALRATAANRARFEQERAQLEARNLEQKNEAARVAETLEGKSFLMIRPAGETGQPYGSVSTRDIAAAITEGGVSVARQQVVLNTPIKTIGLYTVPVSLHPEVEVSVTVNVARSTEEGERQARGEDLTRREEGPAFETFNPEAEEQETPTPMPAPEGEAGEG
jgi:large subunit ribosomal protein L9